MIAHLRGTLLEKQSNLALVDVGGVGYALMIPVSTYSDLPAAGAEVALHTHTHVREDALTLFGFLTRKERDLFEKLISVSGVGPRLAVTVLSGLPIDDLLSSIRSGDHVRLTRIPGVGRKTGERIILELREKLGPIEAADQARTGAAGGSVEQEVISAMMNLGSSQDAAEAAVSKARQQGAPAEFEPLFRAAMELIRR